jgi:hypothetical protein
VAWVSGGISRSETIDPEWVSGQNPKSPSKNCVCRRTTFRGYAGGRESFARSRGLAMRVCSLSRLAHEAAILCPLRGLHSSIGPFEPFRRRCRSAIRALVVADV